MPVVARSFTGLLVDALALYSVVRRTWRGELSTSGQVMERRDLFYREAWREAALSRGWSFAILGASALELKRGALRLRVHQNYTSLDDPVTLRVTEDKPLVHRLLRERGLPVPRHHVCRLDDISGAWHFVSSAGGGPCVVKPARGTAGGVGVTTGVRSRRALTKAMALAGGFGRYVMLEEQLEGSNYRLLYFEGELLGATRRDPPQVKGDGRSTVRQLVAKENEYRLSHGVTASQTLISIDQELRLTLREQGYRLSSVPPGGQAVKLKRVINDNRREDNRPATKELCDEVVRAGALAAATVGAHLAGVDIITADPSRSLAESRGAIIEVNTTPGLYYHYPTPAGEVPVAGRILEKVASAETRCPGPLVN